MLAGTVVLASFSSFSLNIFELSAMIGGLGLVGLLPGHSGRRVSLPIALSPLLLILAVAPSIRRRNDFMVTVIRLCQPVTASTRAGTCLCHGVPANQSRSALAVSSFGAAPVTTETPVRSG
jgi:hypothetical protein